MKYTKKIILIFLVIVVVIITFYSQYNSLLKDIESTAKSKEAQINRHIDLSKGFVDLMTIYGNDFFKYDKISDSDLYSLLIYDSSLNNFNLDSAGGTKYEKIVGNLTGAGSIPISGVNRDEVNLALQFNQLFSSVYKRIPDVAWIYYTSENKFINLFPWVSSKDFSFEETLNSEVFYTTVDPLNNPLRESKWTPVYLDHAGKGLMVTLSSPIYAGNTFKGVVSLDLTNDQLSAMIDSDYDIYIIDETDTVIANSHNIKDETEVSKLNTMLNSSDSIVSAMKAANSNTVQIVGNYYIYSVSFTNAPWEMFFRVPVWLIVGKSALFTLPILTICLLLLFTFFEVEKRKRSERLLTKSFEELSSYQTLLENAAKYDFLTASVNRRGMMDIFNKNIQTDGKIEKPVIFVMGDIDNFKTFNDTYGHAAGDKVLIEIANTMRKNTRSDEVVCRWGGEEFVIMLLDRTYGEAMLIAENIRREIDENIIPWENSVNLRATMTFGVVEYDNALSFDINISNADHALYVGKEKGRNQVIGYRDCQ